VTDLLARFHRDGYVHLRGAIPSAQVRAARAAIHDALARDTSHGQMLRFMQSSFLPELASHTALLDVLAPIAPQIASLLDLRQAPTTGSAQIALRFPQREPSREVRHGFHVDGFPSAGNDVATGSVDRCTLLVGAYLTPVRGPDRGNFVVWPGSHRVIAAWLREIDALAFLRTHGSEALLARIRALDPGPEKQLEVEPGDVVLAHHLLGHGAADNLSLQTREALYFRLLHPSDDRHDPAPLLDETRFFAPA
jgi:ectoine hydroxylase-related dioxygenase (phytanoyl-CoA dioxygenase family)